MHGSPNPWDEADGLDHVLKYAQELGYTTQRSAMHPTLGQALQLPLLDRICELQDELHKLQLQLQLRQNDAKTQDVMSKRRVVERIKMVQDLHIHVQNLVEQRPQMAQRLAVPQDFIWMQAEDQRNFQLMFEKIVSNLSELGPHLQTLDWAQQTSVEDPQMESQLQQLGGVLGAYREVAESIDNMRQAMNELKTKVTGEEMAACCAV